MDCVEVFKNSIDADTLQKVKVFLSKCEYKYVPDSNRIIIPHENSPLFNDIFSQLKDTSHLELIEIECFMIKKSTSDDFSYESKIKDGQIFDLQIVRSGRKNNLVGNHLKYKDEFVNVMLKQIIITIFVNNYLTVKDDTFNYTELQDIINFTQVYNFEKTLYDPHYFIFSLLIHLKRSLKKNVLFVLFDKLQKLFSIFFAALKEHQTGLFYHKKMNKYLFDGYNFTSYEKNMHNCLLELIVEKLNSAYGNSYFQYALPNDPILYNIPLKENQCIRYPSNLIHKREPYETFTDDDVIHILFKCCNNLKK